MFPNRRRSNNEKYALSEYGKRKIEDAKVTGPTYDVLDYLNDHGISSVGEIARHYNHNPRRLEIHMERMEREEYIQKVQKGESEI